MGCVQLERALSRPPIRLFNQFASPRLIPENPFPLTGWAGTFSGSARDAMLTNEYENFGEPSISNAELEYLQLPQFGAEHFNLEDISLLAALDDWWAINGEDDPDFDELVANKEA